MRFLKVCIGQARTDLRMNVCKIDVIGYLDRGIPVIPTLQEKWRQSSLRPASLLGQTCPSALPQCALSQRCPKRQRLAAANKRVGNILKKAEGTVQASVNDGSLLVEPAEKALANALKSIAPHADSAWAAGNYTENLQALAALKAPVDAFFDGVMVNAEDPALKANRLGLLAKPCTTQ